MKYILLLIFCSATYLHSQVNVNQSDIINFDNQISKKIMSGVLYKQISEIRKSGEIDKFIHIFLYFEDYPNNSQILQLESYGAIIHLESWVPAVKNHPYGFLIATIHASSFENIASFTFIKKISSAEHKLYPDASSAVQSIRADTAKLWGFTGKGVKIGILDTGLDYLPDNPDLPDNVEGRDYSDYPNSIGTDIENNFNGHGSHVSGIALGRGKRSELNTANGGTSYAGIAPDADLSFIRISGKSTGSATISAMIGGFNKLVNDYKVDVINMSFGGWFDHHDGSSSVSQAVDMAYSNGIPVFISSGNRGLTKLHYKGTANAQSTTDFIRINHYTTGNELTINTIWSDGDENIELDINYYDEDFQLIEDVVRLPQTESTRGTESRISYLSNDAPPSEYRYYVKLTNNSDQDIDYHLFLYEPASLVEFQEPDNNYSIGIPALADHAFAVGAYVSRNSWQNMFGNITSEQYTVGEVPGYSSKGPRIDGMQKPNAVAPGSMIISIRSKDAIQTPSAYWVDNDGQEFGDADYFVTEGTSMASPVAAGAAALILERTPNATPAQVYAALENSAVEDNFTGNIPNTASGNGKINIARALLSSELPPIIQMDEPENYVCLSSTTEHYVHFTVNKKFNNDNIFTVQLSDATGDFSNPRSIGELESDTSNSIKINYPISLIGTSGYKIRIVSSNPISKSNVNINDIEISDAPRSTITGNQDVCVNSIEVYKTVLQPGISSKWSVSGGEIIGSDVMDSVVVEWHLKDENSLKLVRYNPNNDCADYNIIDIDVIQKPIVNIQGDMEVCSGRVYTYSSDLTQTHFDWEVEGGEIINQSANSVNVIWNDNTENGSIKLIKSYFDIDCKDSIQKEISFVSTISPEIAGERAVIKGKEYTYRSLYNIDVINEFRVQGGEIIDETEFEINVIWNESEAQLTLIQEHEELGCIDSIFVDINVNEISIPRIQLANDYCENEVYELDIDNPDNLNLSFFTDDFEIIESNNNSLIFRTLNPGLTEMKLVYANDDISIQDSVLYEFEVLEKADITFDENISICSFPRNVQFDFAEPKGGNYSGDNIENNMLSSDDIMQGKYKIYYTLENENGCISKDSTEIELILSPDKPIITKDQNDNLVSSHKGTNKWYFEEELIENENGSVLKPVGNGIYSVVAVGNEGCESDFSEEYIFSSSSVIYNENDFIKIFPNPSSGVFTIKDIAIKNIKIFDLLGNEINFEKNQSANFIEVSIIEATQGVYTLLIRSGDKLYTKKIMIY